jgi:hypothetical protein
VPSGKIDHARASFEMGGVKRRLEEGGGTVHGGNREGDWQKRDRNSLLCPFCLKKAVNRRMLRLALCASEAIARANLRRKF